MAQAEQKSRLSEGQGIVYKAFKRPYDGNEGAPVLNLFASCVYPTGGREIWFVVTRDGTYQLRENIPGIVNELVTYVVACYTSGAGLLELGKTVTIQDAFGLHQVVIEPMKERVAQG